MMQSVPTLSDQAGTEHILSPRYLVGRSDDCDLKLASDKVSRHHARLTVEDDCVYVEDLGSSNGTRVNGRAISEKTALQAEDQIAFDHFLFVLHLPSPDDETLRDVVPGQDADPGLTEIVPATDPGGTVEKQAAAVEAGVDSALPGSWVEGEQSDSTQFFSPGQLSAQAAIAIERYGDLPQMIVLETDGTALEVIELEIGHTGGKDVWEIGRQSDCDVVLHDDTVSSRHAQLVHRGGRWRMVNLVSSNGIVVNGERRLSVFLDDGDVVELGSSRLMFFAEKMGAAGGDKRRNAAGGAWRLFGKVMAALAVGAVIIAAAIWVFLRQSA